MRFILKDVRQWKLKYDLLRFGVLSLVVVIFWGGVELYTTHSSTSAPIDYSKEVEPLNPFLDLEMIKALESRVETPENFQVVVVVGDPENSEEKDTEKIDVLEDPSILVTPPAASESGSQ